MVGSVTAFPPRQSRGSSICAYLYKSVHLTRFYFWPCLLRVQRRQPPPPFEEKGPELTAESPWLRYPDSTAAKIFYTGEFPRRNFYFTVSQTASFSN